MSKSLRGSATLQTVADAAQARKLRRRDVPGLTALPAVMASPPTITHGTTELLAGSTVIPPWYPGGYTFSGGVVAKGTVYPDYLGYGTQAMYTNTSSSAWAAECDLDIADSTGRFEIQMKPDGAGAVRIGISSNGGPMQYVAAAPSIYHDSTNTFHLVTMGAPGRYRVRLEMSGNARFNGIAVAVTDTVRAVRPAAKRLVVVGDSFTEPTIQDSNQTCGNDGWVQRLGLLLNVNAISAGSGGTGYMNPGAGGRTTFRGRSVDWLSLLSPGDILMFAGGINDTSYTAAQVGAEAAACFALCPPGVELVVLSPFWPRGFQSFSSNLLAIRDAIKTAAANANATYLDLLQLPSPEALPAPSTLAAATAGTPSTVSSVASYGGGTYLQIGTDANAEVRMVTGVSGSGPYTLSFGGSYNGLTGGGNLARTHNLGDPLIPCGPSYVTGTGKQGTTTGDGNADRYTGADATHPTAAGHLNLAIQTMTLYVAKLEN